MAARLCSGRFCTRSGISRLLVLKSSRASVRQIPLSSRPLCSAFFNSLNGQYTLSSLTTNHKPSRVEQRRFANDSTENKNQDENPVDDEAQDTVHIISNTEKVTGPAEKCSFQAETKQLLDIVAKSLYSEKEVFIREIISNSSDALEKVRHQFMTGKEISDSELPLEINIATSEGEGTFTIQDYGVGMAKEELIEHLGTIAKSGSKAFLHQLQKEGKSTHENIIGQFGVGFYSTFMVANRVDVYSRSSTPGEKGYLWTSDGSGSFEISEAEGVSRGTKVILHLKEDCKRFALKTAVEEIIQKYSNFVGFPIYLNGSCINTIQPLWTLDPKSISDEEHQEFYQFIAKTADKPRYHFHFKTDAPLNISSVFYFPETLPHMFGLARLEPGVALYSKKVLIQQKAESVLPHWLRFVKAVVDSEDIPLNLSRELLQDSALIRKLNDILTSRIVKFLQDQSKRDRVKYEKFFRDCGIFLREGIVTSESNELKEGVSKLLLFESSAEKPGALVSLPVYVERMKPSQKKIYYLCAPSRELAETSPYFEALKESGMEVLFTYNEQDDIALHYLKNYEGKAIISAENYMSEVEELPRPMDAEDETTKTPEADQLPEGEAKDLAEWLKTVLGKQKVTAVKVSKRLGRTNHPAMVTVPDMVAAKHWLRLMRAEQQKDIEGMKYQILQPTLEINPSHDIIKNLQKARTSNTQLAALVADQLFDNALISAGLIEDPRTMIGRLNSLLSKALETSTQTSAPQPE